MCGAQLISQDLPAGLDKSAMRTESPGPVLNHLPAPGLENNESIKLSFRGGGEKIFHERLKGSMTQRKWLLQGARPVPKPGRPQEPDSPGSGSSTPTGERVKTAGIAGLEQRRLEVRKNNELAIGSAFEDLETLMASAKQIVALAESFAASNGAKNSSESSAVANALGLVTTKDMLGGGSSSESLYISELSRNLAEFLTDDARGVLRKAGGIISLVDLWAVFNRARGGVELVSPLDFEKAARLWEKLKLPVRLRQFKSGVLVVQASDRTDEKTIKALLAWLSDLHVFPPDKDLAWDWQVFGRGVTAQDAAERFGWSIGVAEEELEMAEERGALCREDGIEGLKFWENWIDEKQAPQASIPYVL
jgi:ESCRT-II complex subunit VPS36